MARAEFATGSIEVRGSRPVHRLLGVLAEFFFGIVPEGRAQQKSLNWWEREPAAPEQQVSGPTMVFGHQAELFDADGQVVAAPVVQKPVARTAVVSAPIRSRTSSRVVTTTRSAVATRVSAVSKTATKSQGEVGRHLMMSLSLSSGREESRWFSVPQRALLPRFQLFEGAPAVIEEKGRFRVGSRASRAQRGRVWFV